MQILGGERHKMTRVFTFLAYISWKISKNLEILEGQSPPLPPCSTDPDDYWVHKSGLQQLLCHGILNNYRLQAKVVTATFHINERKIFRFHNMVLNVGIFYSWSLKHGVAVLLPWKISSRSKHFTSHKVKSVIWSYHSCKLTLFINHLLLQYMTQSLLYL